MAPWDENYSSQLQDLLAPYRQQAQQMSSPYETMPAHGWLQTHHPKIAGMLDNAFLTAAMTPEGGPTEGVGGGISRTFQGLMGAQQQRRRSAIEDMMLPYQMLQPQLQARGELAKIGQEGAATNYYRSHAEYMDEQVRQMKNPKAVVDTSEMYDDAGRAWNKISTRRPDGTAESHMVPILPQGQSLPEGYEPTFQQHVRRQGGGGGLEAGIIDMQMSPDPAIQAEGYRRAHLYTTLEGAKAGGRTAGEQGAEHPQVVSQDLISAARSTVMQGLDKPPTDAMEHFAKNFSKFKSLEEAQADVDARQGGYQSTILARQQSVDAYIASGAHKQGISYSKWMEEQNPNRVAAKPTGSKKSGSNWQPPQ